MRKAVIFDLDGTLIDSIPDIARCMNKALTDAGLPAHPERAYRHMTGNGARTLTERAVGAHRDAFDRVYAQYRETYALHCTESTAPYAGVISMLRTLRRAGVAVCVLSNKDDSDAKRVVRRYFPDIDFVIVRGRLPGVPIKPAPDAALSILNELQISHRDAWYCGDTPTDMLCAQNAGLDALCVTWGYADREELIPCKYFALCGTPENVTAVILEQ